MKTISIVVQKIQDLGLFPPPRPLPFSVPTSTDADAPSGNRAKLLAEMLNTERVYTADLEKLQVTDRITFLPYFIPAHSNSFLSLAMKRYQRELQNQNAVPRDTLLQLFANLDELLDFQRRFLLQMEATLSLPPVEQRIGQLFMQNVRAGGQNKGWTRHQGALIFAHILGRCIRGICSLLRKLSICDPVGNGGSGAIAKSSRHGSHAGAAILLD